MDATVAAIWEQQRPTMLERLELLGGDDRDAALVAAHQLAGSLGTFGFPNASELARKAEELLKGSDPLRVVEGLDAVVEELRADLDLPAFVATTVPAGPVVILGDCDADLQGAMRAASPEDLPAPPAVVVVADLALCRAVRERWAATAIVAVTEDLEAAFAAGADDAATIGDLPARVAGRLTRSAALRELIDRDDHTGLTNRRAATASLRAFVRMGERFGQPVSVIVVSVPPAHAPSVGTALRESVRAEDVVAHWGNGELVIGMFATKREAAVNRAKDLMVAIEPERYGAGVAQFPMDGPDFERVCAAARAAAQDGKVSSAGDDTEATHQVDVVIVEDEEAISEAMARRLTAEGHSCWRFANGAGAIAMLLGETPELRAKVMLLDLQMPAVDGFELLTLLNREGLLADMRVIVVSSRTEAEEQTRAMGAIDFVPKPVDLERLTERVELALGRG